jgi:DNA-binding MarR family transcriptional regulator
MALSATFVANFSSLYKELDKAEVRFKEVAVDAEKVQSSIQKIGERFSGQRVIEDAAKMAAAIESIGGASILTEKEARRVNAALSEALEKAAKTGAPVTDQMRKLAEETAGAAKQGGIYSKVLDGVSTSFASMTAAFSAGMIINQLIGSIKQFASEALQSAGNLVDLRAATGVSLEMLQRWTLVAQQGGIELENLTKASFKLGNQLTEGKSSTRGAVEALGLSFDALRSLKPEQQLDAVLKAAEPLGNTTERNALLTTLFGEKAALALARVVDGYTDLAESTKVATDAQIEAVDRATNAYDKLTTTITTGFVQAIGNLFRQATETGLSIDQMTEAQRNHYMALVRAGGGAELYALQLKDQRDAQAQATKAAEEAAQTQSAAAVVQQNYSDVLRQTLAEVQKLDPETRKQIKAARDLGVSQEDLTDRFGLTAAQLKLLTDVERDAEKETSKNAQATLKHAQAVAALVSELSGAGAIEKVRVLNDAFKSLTPEQQNNKRVVDEVLGQYVKLREIVGEKMTPALEKLFVTFGTLGNRTMQFSKQMWELRAPIESVSGALDALDAKPLNLFSTLAPSLKSMNVSAATLGGTIKDSLSSSLTELPKTILGALQGGGNVMSSVGSLFGSGLGTSLVQNFGGKITGMLGKTMGGALNAVIPGLGAVAGQLLGAGMSNAMGWIKGLFSDPLKKEIEAANKEIDKLKDAMLSKVGGSVDQLEEQYNALGLSIREAFSGTGKQGLEALQAVQAEFNKRLEESKTRLADLQGELKTLEGNLSGLISKAYEMGYVFNTQGELIGFNFDKVAQVAKEFGVDLESLGPAFQQAQLTAEAQKVIDAFTLLTMSGADVGSVLTGMKDEINKIVQDSLKFGTVIPANMKPWIEELIRTGQLTDANGQKITDISQIKFGDDVKSEYVKINDSIKTVLTAMQTLIDQISGLVAAIDAATRPRTLVVTAEYHDPGPPPGFGDPTDGGNEPGFATGTIGRGSWFRNFGTGTPTMLHGTEAVVRQDQAGAFAAAIGGGNDTALELAGLRSDVMALPHHIARAVRDAILVAG